MTSFRREWFVEEESCMDEWVVVDSNEPSGPEIEPILLRVGLYSLYI